MRDLPCFSKHVFTFTLFCFEQHIVCLDFTKHTSVFSLHKVLYPHCWYDFFQLWGPFQPSSSCQEDSVYNDTQNPLLFQYSLVGRTLENPYINQSFLATAWQKHSLPCPREFSHISCPSPHVSFIVSVWENYFSFSI